MFAAAYLLWLYQRTAFGEPSRPSSPAHGGHAAAHAVGAAVNARARTTTAMPTSTTSRSIEWIAWTPMLILILVLGVYPQLLFKVIDPAVDAARRPPRGRHLA